MKRRATLTAIGSSLLLPGRLVPAQAPRSARIGIVEYGAAPDSPVVRIYLEGLRSHGYREGGNLFVERRYAQTRASEFAGLLRDLAAQKVDVVFAAGHDIAKVAKEVIPGMPVVTTGSEDPVASGLIRSFNRPGGSVTGVSFMSPELAPKRLELLKETIPGLVHVGVLWEPAHADVYYQEFGKVAAGIGIRLRLATLREIADIDGAFAELRGAAVQALFVVPSRLTNFASRRIADLALMANLPAMSAYASFAEAGGLMSYGAATRDSVLRAAALTAQIVAGAKPGDMPFELPHRFEMVVNLKTAKAIGVTVPQTVLLRADRVIE